MFLGVYFFRVHTFMIKWFLFSTTKNKPHKIIPVASCLKAYLFTYACTECIMNICWQVIDKQRTRLERLCFLCKACIISSLQLCLVMLEMHGFGFFAEVSLASNFIFHQLENTLQNFQVIKKSLLCFQNGNIIANYFQREFINIQPSIINRIDGNLVFIFPG